MTPSFRFLMAAMILAALTGGDYARADDFSGFFVGGNFGRARSLYDTGYIDSQVVSAATSADDGLGITDRSIRRMSDTWWFNAGYFFTQYVGMDVAFIHLGEIKYTAVGTLATPGGNETLTAVNELNSHGPALSLILRLPITESFDLRLRLGDYYGKALLDNTLTVSGDSELTRTPHSGSSLLAGAGAAYNIAGHWSVRLDFLRFNKTGDSNSVGQFSVNVATAGVSYTF